VAAASVNFASLEKRDVALQGPALTFTTVGAVCDNRVHQSMKPDDFRRIALGMTEAIEGAHMGHPDFRANGKIFATLYPDGRHGMVKLTPDQQQEFMRANPTLFESASGAWGRQGCTMVRLASADEDVVGEAMTLAWRETARKPATRRARAKSAARPGRPSPKRK
jgi:hypothetical protein